MVQQLIHDTAEAAAYRVIELVSGQLHDCDEEQLFRAIYGILSESLGVSLDWQRSLVSRVSSN